jgi:hypothetical protein
VGLRVGMALHPDATATGLRVYFDHPHSPWERDSNENLNRIVRDYLPRGVEITSDPTYLAAIAAEINNRPPQTPRLEEAEQGSHRTPPSRCFHRLNSPPPSCRGAPPLSQGRNNSP